MNENLVTRYFTFFLFVKQRRVASLCLKSAGVLSNFHSLFVSPSSLLVLNQTAFWWSVIFLFSFFSLYPSSSGWGAQPFSHPIRLVYDHRADSHMWNASRTKEKDVGKRVRGRIWDRKEKVRWINGWRARIRRIQWDGATSFDEFSSFSSWKTGEPCWWALRCWIQRVEKDERNLRPFAPEISIHLFRFCPSCSPLSHPRRFLMTSFIVALRLPLSLFLLLRLRHCLTSIQPSPCDFLISSRRFLSLALALCNRHTQTRLFRLIIHGRVRANLNDSGRCASFTQHPDAPSSPSCSSFSRTKLWPVPPVTYPQLIDAITWLGIYIVHEVLDSLRTSTALRDGSQVEEIGVTFEYVGRNIVVIYRR